MPSASNGNSKALERPLLPQEDVPSLGCREEGLTQSQTLSPQQSSLLGFTCDSEGCGNGGAICNVAVTAIGAGMLALPKAMERVGVILGFTLFGTVCLLTYFSSSIIIRYASRRGKRTYSELIEGEFGLTGARVLQTSIIIHVSGVMIVYLIIIADMLVGAAPEWHGVLPTLLDRHDGVWFLSRPFVCAVLLVVAIAPMLISRELTVVARYSRNSIIMMLFLSSTMIALAGVALWQGKAAAIHILPTPLDPKCASGCGTLVNMCVAILSVLSVSCLAFTCQFNLLPVHLSLKDGRCSNMLSITRKAIALCAALYGTVAISGYIMFGKNTQGDVLRNLTIRYVSTLVHPVLASVLIDFIVLATTFNLLVNFVLKVWAVRESVSEMFYGLPALELSLPRFYLLTYGLSLAAYLTSVFIPSVWVMLSLVGSTACVTFSYIFPGLIMARNGKTRLGRVGGGSTVIMAVVMATVAITNTLSGHADL
ncbi:hypothetical protein ACKKBG_A24015 [Auxenochlorella protothecoides x Auxenochlorella symbiontica]